MLATVITLLAGIRPVGASIASGPVAHYKLRVGPYYVQVVRVNLHDPRISIVTVVAPHGKATLHQLIRRYRPVAAINGTFFDTRTWRITGNVVQRGHLVREGYVGNAMAFTDDNKPILIRNSGRMGRHTNWTRFTAAIGGGPTLMSGGRIQLDPRAEGFHDPGLFRFARRSAIGCTKSGSLLMVSVQTPVTFHQLAFIMDTLGVRDALSLDGGSSSALYCNGCVLSAPRRRLTNLLAIYQHTMPVIRGRPRTVAGVPR